VSTCDITRLDNWTLAQPANDTTPLELQLLRLPKGSNDRENDETGFNGTMTLTTFVTGIVEEYKQRLTDLDEAWGKQVKAYIEGIDDKARTILSELAGQLANCEFNLPAMEYCLTFRDCAAGTVVSPSASAAVASHAKPRTNGSARTMKMGVRDWRTMI
jgi:hypothetical protein